MIKFLRFNQFSFPAFFSLLLCLLPLALAAQEAPVSASFTPPDGWEEGDEVEMIISYGSTEVELRNLTEVEFVIEMPEGVLVSSSSNLEVHAQNSWFAFDNNWIGSAEASEDGYSVNVSLVRTNEISASGYGEVARVKGLIMEVDELMFKTGLEVKIEVRELKEQTANPITVDQTTQRISFAEPIENGELLLLDVQGRILRSGSVDSGISYADLPRQVLFVKLVQNGQYLSHKVIY